MKAHRISALLVCALFPMPSAAFAQSPDEPSPGGIWWEISAGAGGMRLTCAICDPTRELGPAISGAVGAYGSPRVRVGLEGGGWANDDGDVRESVYRAGLVAQLHPRPDSGLHLIGGLGWSGYRAELFTYDAIRLTLGAGWDLPLTGDWVVGNRLLLDAASFASLKNDEGAIASPVGLSVMTFGLYIRRR
ncbi:MAG: hypothetical protein OEO79_09175 [Gemmatimonadota bacterium]|nr:hypothetical protein [Gemmatimonadota bacterium]